MFDFLGTSELALVFVLIIILFNAKDMVKVIKFMKKTYDQAQSYYYKLKGEIMYEPPTEEELKARKETEEFYKKYGEGYDPYKAYEKEHSAEEGKSPYPTDDDPEADEQKAAGSEGTGGNQEKPGDRDKPGDQT